jgi:hypothetical protein
MEGFKVRAFNRRDSEGVIKLISDIIVNEFKFKLEIDSFYEITNLVSKHWSSNNYDYKHCLYKAIVAYELQYFA